jgi:uncharacterized protein (TIGR02646 family)
MKYIEKGEEPGNLTEWRRKKSEDIIRLSRAGNMDNVFKLLQNQPKQETGVEEPDSYTKMQLREDLLHEQGFLCAYCTQRIENSYKTKIDHFQPKETPHYHHLVFAYSNLLACCDGGERDSFKPRELYCDTKKGQKDPTKPEKLISPLDEDCADHFVWDEFGNIASANEKSMAEKTINFYGLNSKALTQLRKAAIDAFITEVWPEIETDLAIAQLKQKANNRYYPFCTAITSVLNQYN